MGALAQLGIFFALLLAGYLFGRRAESRHYREIREREDQLRHLLVLAERFPPEGMLRHQSQLVNGSVVISVDYFKTVVAGLRNLVGGNVSAYETLLDRARREAILRMQEQADSLGAQAVINMKFETARVSGNAAQGLGSVEVLAYGTALIPPGTAGSR
ncbi:YbjQ family protein [Haliea sp. E17]|uniref:YbjQ family protein n=1 Tax=Haliea sp. E17 TaxID=3401576 RepID=UPI003AAEDD59